MARSQSTERRLVRRAQMIELNVLIGQCLNRWIDNIEALRREVAAWQAQRDLINARIDWRFSVDNTRIKLKRLYPAFYQ